MKLAIPRFGETVAPCFAHAATITIIEFDGHRDVDRIDFTRKEMNLPHGVLLMGAPALLGATFVGMQAFEWTKLIVDEGVRPWGNPMGAAQFGASFFMITGFHGMHVSAGVIYLTIVATRVGTGYYDRHRGGNYEMVEIAGLYWHFVDLVWVFIFAFFYLW